MRAVVSLLAAGCLATGVSSFTTAARAPDLSGAGKMPLQTITVEPFEGRVRLGLEGPETWSVDANAFDVIAVAQGIQFRAQPAGIDVRTPKQTASPTSSN